MKNLNLPNSIGEFFDRLTILVRKDYFDSDVYNKRLGSLLNSLSEFSLNSQCLYLVCKLMMINTDIWNLESELRNGGEGSLGLIEVGKRAIQIRNLNKERIAICNSLSSLYGQTDMKEEKIDHASE